MTEPPVLRIVAGGPVSDEEIAAVTAVLALAAAGSAAGDDRPDSGTRWRDSGRPATASAQGWLAQARQAALRRSL